VRRAAPPAYPARSPLSLRNLRIGEAHRFDVTIENGKVTSYRVRLNVSFKYESGD
jgi:flavin-binding protein dodecin